MFQSGATISNKGHAKPPLEKKGLENLVLKEEMKRTRYKSCAVKRSDESVYAC